MKKIYILTILLVFNGLLAQSQSLTATAISISGDPMFFMEAHATITNISSSSKDVTVARTINNLFPGHNSYFCWVQCYGAQTSVSPDNLTLAAGQDTDVFRGDLETNAISGISIVKYCFYDVNNIADSVCVEYLYDATTGLADIPAGRNYISKPYPNPASVSASFYVNTLPGVKNSKVKIFNMLGTEVKEVSVVESKNQVKVNVSDLKPGIYFYSLFVNGKSSTTGKLMVARD